MGMAIAELPLALFTTLAPIGAGAFVMLFVAFLRGSFTQAQLKAADKFTAVPLLVALAGLACSFAHLANPGNALNVLATVGRTPLANEVVAFGVFFGLAALYWVVALAGGLKRMGARRAFSAVVAAAALVFAVFAGMAYWIPTVPVWGSSWTPAMSVGIELFGGMMCGQLVLVLAGADSGLDSGGADTAVFSLLALGAALVLASTVRIWAVGSAAQPVLFDIAAHVASLIAVFVAFIVLAVVCVGLGFFVVKVAPAPAPTACALALIAVACLLARLVFYGFQIGAGF